MGRRVLDRDQARPRAGAGDGDARAFLPQEEEGGGEDGLSAAGGGPQGAMDAPMHAKDAGLRLWARSTVAACAQPVRYHMSCVTPSCVGVHGVCLQTGEHVYDTLHNVNQWRAFVIYYCRSLEVRASFLPSFYFLGPPPAALQLIGSIIAPPGFARLAFRDGPDARRTVHSSTACAKHSAQ